MEDALSGLGDDFEWVVPDHPEGAVRHGARQRDRVLPRVGRALGGPRRSSWELERGRTRPALATMQHARAGPRAAARRPRCASASSGAFRGRARRANGRCSTTSTRRAGRRGSHDRTTRSYVRPRLARRRSGCRVRGSGPTPSSGLCPVIPTAPSATGRTPSPISSATGSRNGRTSRDTDWKLEVTRPDTVLALGHDARSRTGQRRPGRDDLCAGFEGRTESRCRMVLYPNPERGRRAAEAET